MALTQETIDALGQDERDAVLALLARIEALEASQGDGSAGEAETDAAAAYGAALMARIQATASPAERTHLWNYLATKLTEYDPNA